MLQHLFGVEVCDEERDVISLCTVSGLRNGSEAEGSKHTLTAFLRRMKNDSARWVKKRVNLWTRICSISSACFILRLMRTLFMLGSIKTLSFSLRDTVRGFKRTSGELAASISGTLCRSEVCEAKSERERAAVKEDRTHCRYGRRDCD